LKNLLSECQRVLKNGGILYINSETYEQLRYGFWWCTYFPATVINRYINKFTLDNEVVEWSEEKKLKHVETFIIKEPMQKDYVNSRNVLHQSFRDADSLWSILSDDELENILRNIRQDIHIERNISHLEKIREAIGQSTSYVFTK
jgi:hypothetical protein